MNKILTAIGLSLAISGHVHAEDAQSAATSSSQTAGVVIPNIDSASYELGFYAGSMRIIADSDNTIVYGSRLSYHINDLLFVEGSIAGMNIDVSHELEGQEGSKQGVGSYYYNGSVGFNLIPGELFFSPTTVVPIYFYALLGAGNTVLDDTNTFSLNFGGGMRLLLSDSIAVRMDIQDHIFNAADAVGSEDQFSWNNLEVTVGASWFF